MVNFKPPKKFLKKLKIFFSFSHTALIFTCGNLISALKPLNKVILDKRTSTFRPARKNEQNSSFLSRAWDKKGHPSGFFFFFQVAPLRGRDFEKKKKTLRGPFLSHLKDLGFWVFGAGGVAPFGGNAPCGGEAPFGGLKKVGRQ